MNRLGITFEKVVEAAETIQAKGENPTIDRVRSFLGGTGSNTTIGKYLHNWRNQLVHTSSVGSSSTPPDPVQMAVKRVWQQIREETDAEILTIKEEAVRAVSIAEEKVLAEINEREQLAHKCQKQQEEIYALQARNEIQQLDWKKIQLDHALLQERHRGLDERFMDLQRITLKQQEEAAKSHQNEINLLVEKAHAQEIASQKLLDELKIYNEDQRIRHMQEMDAYKTKCQILEQDAHSLKSTNAAKDLEIVKLKTQLSALIKEQEGLLKQLNQGKNYWNLIEKNFQVTNNMWSELKEMPKWDSSLFILDCLSEFKNKIDSSVNNFCEKSLDFKSTFKKFEQYVKNEHE